MAIECRTCAYTLKTIATVFNFAYYAPRSEDNFGTVTRYFGEPQLQKIIKAATLNVKKRQEALRLLLAEAKAHESLHKALAKASNASHARMLFSDRNQLGLEISDTQFNGFNVLFSYLHQHAMPNGNFRVGPTRTTPPQDTLKTVANTESNRNDDEQAI